MITRLLPREEWDRLRGTELEAVWPHLPPGAQVVVVEDDDRILGCWALFHVLHVEGCWIAPAARGNPRVALRLLSGMQATAQGMGARAVATAATDPAVVSMIERLGGTELPGRHFSVCVEAKKQRK